MTVVTLNLDSGVSHFQRLILIRRFPGARFRELDQVGSTLGTWIPGSLNFSKAYFGLGGFREARFRELDRI